MQSGQHFLAADDDAQIVADEFGSPLHTCDCDGLRVRFTAIESGDIDAVIDGLASAGHGVAVAAQIGDANSEGYAPTAIVRNVKPRGGDTSESSQVHTAEELRGFAARLHAMIEELYPDIRAIAIRTIKAWLDALLSEQARCGDAGLWPEAWRESLSPWYILEDMAAAIAPLSEENQRRAVRMVHRFGELISTHTGVTDEPFDSEAGTVEPGPRLCISRTDGGASAS